jgi:hypothetical protein
MYEIKCKQCNKIFFHADKRQKFCERKCYDSWKVGENNGNWRGGGLNFHCKECGKSFNIEKNMLKHKKHSGIFCSKECRFNNRKKNSMPVIQKRLAKQTLKLMTRTMKKQYQVKVDWLDRFGYDHTELKSHIESQLKQGMNWSNYGEVWVIDHIKPTCSFRFTCVDDEFKKCFSLENLQPLFNKENMKKGSK